MKTIERTSKRIVIETTKAEIKQMGFDALWDSIREIHPSNLFEIDQFKELSDNKTIHIELKLAKY